MDKPSLAELTAAAGARDGPGFPAQRREVWWRRSAWIAAAQLQSHGRSSAGPKQRGTAHPSLVIVAWAWRRAIQLTQSRGLEKIPPDHLPNFVDRIKVLYAWSELLKNTKVDLPGRQALWRVFRERQQ